MQTYVYKSLRKPDTYLYLPKADAFAALPEAVAAPLQPWQFVLEFELTPGRRLALAVGVMGVLLLWRHAANIQRLIAGQESRIGSRKK